MLAATAVLAGLALFWHFRPRPLLVASIGMPLEEARRLSTLKLGPGIPAPGNVLWFVVTDAFDFALPSSSLRFDGCRYASFDAAVTAPSLITRLAISVSPRRRTWAEMKEDLSRTEARLRGDGWARTPGDLELTQVTGGGRPEWSTTPAGTWRKGGLELWVLVKRQVGDVREVDPGDLIQEIDLIVPKQPQG